MNSIVVTGDRPTGHLHLGHYVGSLTQRLALQNTHDMFVLIADTQVLNNDLSKSRFVRENTLALMRDYLRVGLSPERVHFVLQSQVSALFEATHYLSNLVSLASVMRNPTIKNENKIYNRQMNMGFLNYPVSQTADVIMLGGELVPVGADQVPILEFANDLVDKFHYSFECSIFKHITPLLSDTPRLTGLDGKNKMSKSLNNAIFLTDNEKTLKKKINLMYTDEKHLAISDPGQVEGNVVFDFLSAFMQDKAELERLKTHYRQGGLGDGYLKGLLYTILNDLMLPFREKEYHEEDLMDILQAGTQYAKTVAYQNLNIMKEYIFG